MSDVIVGSVGVQLVPSAEGFREKVKGLLSGLTVPVQIDVDDTIALGKLEELTRPRSATINAEADVAKAETELDAVARSRSAKIDVDSRGLAKASQNASGLGGAMGVIASAAAFLGPALVPIGAALAGIGVFAGVAIKAVTTLEAENKKINTLRAKGTAAALAQAKLLEDSLSKPQQRFLAAQAQLSDAFSGLVKKVGPSIFGPLAAGMKLLADILPRLAPLIRFVGTALSGVLRAADRWAKGDGFTKAMRYIMKSIPSLISFVGAFGAVLLKLMVGLAPAGLVLLKVLTGVFNLIAKIPAEILGPLALALVGLIAGPEVAGIAALAIGFETLYAKSSKFRDVVSSIVSAVVSFGRAAFAALMPTLQQIGDIITTKVMPILSSFGSFFVGTLLPIFEKTATSIAHNLKPILDQLGQTFRTQILPTISKVLTKFHEWQPTIEKVVGAAAKLQGKLLTFEALVVGKVIPVVIRLAGFLFSRLVPAILRVDGFLIRVIGAMISFGVAVTRVAVKVVQFVAKVVSTLASLQAKVIGALAGAAKWLFNSGVKIIQGLIDGVKSKAGDVAGAVKGVLSAARNLLPFSPAKTGPFSGRGWTFFSGQSIVAALAAGIAAERLRPLNAIRAVLGPLAAEIKGKGKALRQAMSGVLGPLSKAFADGSPVALGKALAALTSHLGSLPKAAQQAFRSIAADGAKQLKPLTDAIGKVGDKIKALKSEASSIASSVVSAFTPDLFSGTLSDLVSGIGTWQASIGTAMTALSALTKAHVNGGFLSALFASGNTGLISQLGAAPSFAAALGQQYAGTTHATAALGNAVGQAATSRQLAESNRQLALLNQKVEHLAAQIGHEVGVEINGIAKNAGHKANVQRATKPRGR